MAAALWPANATAHAIRVDFRLPSDFDAAEVRGGPLRWLGNNAAKYGPGEGGGEVWTVLSTGAFGKAHKVPQEHVPEAGRRPDDEG